MEEIAFSHIPTLPTIASIECHNILYLFIQTHTVHTIASLKGETVHVNRQTGLSKWDVQNKDFLWSLVPEYVTVGYNLSETCSWLVSPSQWLKYH